MKLKDLRLDVEALFSQTVYGHGFLHYGYFPAGKPDELSLANLGKAQQAYFDKLVATIPQGVSTILDVGSGTGSNALGLTKKGYAVDCVCPSEKLNTMARQKLPESSQVTTCKFEDFTSDKTYDLAMFCESFHYIDAKQALQQVDKYVNNYVIIFDYFRKKDSDAGDRLSYMQFKQLLSDSFGSVYEVLHDEDVTENIMPTFYILDGVKNDHIRPFVMQFICDLKRDRPILYFFLSYPLNKLSRKLQKLSARSEKFLKEQEYRLILMRKKG